MRVKFIFITGSPAHLLRDEFPNSKFSWTGDKQDYGAALKFWSTVTNACHFKLHNLKPRSKQLLAKTITLCPTWFIFARSALSLLIDCADPDKCFSLCNIRLRPRAWSGWHTGSVQCWPPSTCQKTSSRCWTFATSGQKASHRFPATKSILTAR